MGALPSASPHRREPLRTPRRGFHGRRRLRAARRHAGRVRPL